MEALKRLFGMGAPEPIRPFPGSRTLAEDERAVERYRYLLRTAPPETIEQAHVEAFTRLTPEQRRMVLQELSATLPPSEGVSGASAGDDPRALARLATRAEMRQPGTLERTWSGMPAMGPGIAGNPMMGNFMSTFAGVIVGSMVADAFLGGFGGDAAATDGSDTADASTDGGDSGDAGFGGFGDFGGDMGGFGDIGGEF
ncbi:MAG: hypothetical protein U0031_02185 [Thermomicrobiales bacterium]